MIHKIQAFVPQTARMHFLYYVDSKKNVTTYILDEKSFILIIYIYIYAKDKEKNMSNGNMS